MCQISPESFDLHHNSYPSHHPTILKFEHNTSGHTDGQLRKVVGLQHYAYPVRNCISHRKININI